MFSVGDPAGTKETVGMKTMGGGVETSIRSV